MDWVPGVFLIVHGLIHLSWLSPKPDDPKYPFTLEHSTALPSTPPELLRPVGIMLSSAVAVLFIVAGIGVLGVAPLADFWRLASVVGAVLSMALIGVFWSPWFVIGALLDIGIVLAVLTGWGPSA